MNKTELPQFIEAVPVLVQTILTGQGNPATALAIYAMLEDLGAETTFRLLSVSGKVVSVYHKRMTQDPKKSAEYGEKSRTERGGWKATFLSMFSYVEGAVRDWLHPSHAEIFVAVQEHQLLGFTRDQLQKKYPYGVYLYIPDVYPKESAIEIMKKTGVIPLVWNIDAYERLKERALQPELVAPILPSAFQGKAERRFPEVSNERKRILLKSSGSGIPKTYVESLTEAAKRLGYQLDCWYPNRFTSSNLEEDFDVPNTLEDKVKTTYATFERNYDCIITFPSEMAQILAVLRLQGLKSKVICLPPRGEHEIENAEWMREVGVSDGQLENGLLRKHPTDAEIGELMEYIQKIISAKSQESTEMISHHIGKRSLPEILESRLPQSEDHLTLYPRH